MYCDIYFFSGSVLGELRALDIDDNILTFNIQGEIAKSFVELVSTGDKSANLVLKSSLDREVKYQITTR